MTNNSETNTAWKPLAVASFESPSEVLELEGASAARVDLSGRAVWRYAFGPGWRYSEHVDSEGCRAPHLGYIESGTLHVVLEDGTEADAGPGSVLTIGPGHDAWTVGSEPCVMVDFAPDLEMNFQH